MCSPFHHQASSIETRRFLLLRASFRVRHGQTMRLAGSNGTGGARADDRAGPGYAPPPRGTTVPSSGDGCWGEITMMRRGSGWPSSSAQRATGGRPVSVRGASRWGRWAQRGRWDIAVRTGPGKALTRSRSPAHCPRCPQPPRTELLGRQEVRQTVMVQVPLEADLTGTCIWLPAADPPRRLLQRNYRNTLSGRG